MCGVHSILNLRNGRRTVATRTEAPDAMDTATATEYLARNGYPVTDDTLRYHFRRGHISATVYGRKQGSLFVFQKAELDRFLRDEVPRLKVRGNPRSGGAGRTHSASGEPDS